MEKKIMEQYAALNKLAEPGGTVIMGGASDLELPLCELKQDFRLDDKLYNRSMKDLSIYNAVEVYDTYISDLKPKALLLHIGERDRALFERKSEEFDRGCRELICHIRKVTPGCDIVIISLDSTEKTESAREMNRHLEYIADSEQCRYEDISAKHIWDPEQTKEVISFVYSLGFVHPLRQKRPLYDLVRILFCYQNE